MRTSRPATSTETVTRARTALVEDDDPRRTRQPLEPCRKDRADFSIKAVTNVGHKTRHKHDVDRALTDHGVGDMNVTAAGIPDFGCHPAIVARLDNACIPRQKAEQRPATTRKDAEPDYLEPFGTPPTIPEDRAQNETCVPESRDGVARITPGQSRRIRSATGSACNREAAQVVAREQSLATARQRQGL